LSWAAANLSWNPDPAVAHLVFWVADAPPHAENAGKLSDAVRQLRDEKVHVYPVASSGIDEVTEYTMRAAAQLTSGRYLFLTDDSGVGDDHKTPTLPCYAVTKLDASMMRVVASELSGTRVEAKTEDILRTVGDPHDGRCELQEGDAFLF
jgi:hypothetical protein